MTRRASSALCAILLALSLCGCSVGGTPAPASSAADGHGSSTPRSPQATPSAPGALQHVVVIVEENKPASSIIGNPAAPYLNSLARSFAYASDYSAITHPSLPNYLALTSGTTAGITSDCNPPGGSCLVTGPNLARALDDAGRKWRMYAESMPEPCTTTNTALYAVKHNPFLYFPDVTADQASCRSHDVPYDRLIADLATTTSLPDLAFISPNLCDDMHDCSVAHGDAWLQENVPRILESPAFTRQRSLLVVTFDEGDAADNAVPCVFAGSAARAHTVAGQPYTHYSLLRTIEDAWGLPPLTPDVAGAAPMTALLR
jgi:phospholipase C